MRIVLVLFAMLASGCSMVPSGMETRIAGDSESHSMATLGFLAGLLLLLIAPSCSMLAPGKDVREATEARQITDYNAEGAFRSEEATTHNRRNVLAEGTTEAGVAAEFYPDGTPKKISGASNLVTQSSEPKDAATAYMMLAQKNAEVAGEMLKTLQAFIPIIGAQRSPDPNVNNRQSQLEAILGRQDVQEALNLLIGATSRPG